jgi:tetratricopeptide (TPR) repeat protein
MACTRVVTMRDIPAEERAQAYYSRAGAHKDLTGWGRAIADYSEAINHDPNFVDAYLERANLFLLERDFRAALADCLTVIRISPTLDRGHWCAARGYAGRGETRRALSELRRAFRSSGEDVTDRVNRP